MIKIISKSKYLYNYFTVKKYNENAYKITVFKYPIANPGYEINRKYKKESNEYDEKLDNSIARAKSKVFEYALCNEFDYFVTLTLDKKKYNRYDLNTYIKDLGQFIRNYRRNHGCNIQYLLIPETHQDGAWHMHGLLNGISEGHLHTNSNGYLDWKAYRDKFGWISLDKVRNQEAVSKYITKYVTKDMFGRSVTEKHKKLYYVTRGLKQAVTIKNGTLTGRERIPLDNVYENDYVKVIYLPSLEGIKL